MRPSHTPFSGRSEGEGIYESYLLKFALQTFHQRFVEIGEELQYTVDWGHVRNWIGRIDYGFANKIHGIRGTQSIKRGSTLYSKNN